MVSKGLRPAWLDANDRCPATCQSWVSATWAKRRASALTTGTTAPPSGTARAPPGRKSFCTSTTSRRSRSVGVRVMVGTERGAREGCAALRIFAQFGAVGYRWTPATQAVAKFRNRSYEEVRLSYTQNSVSPIDAAVVSLDHPVHAPAVRSGPGLGQCDTQCIALVAHFAIRQTCMSTCTVPCIPVARCAGH